MRNSHEKRNQKAVVLSRALENLLRRLIRFLIGRISLVRLQEITKLAFIEEVEDKLRRDYPEKNVSLTELALYTGLDTRTLTKIRNSDRYRRPLFQEDNFLKNLTPGASIIDAWSSKLPYVESNTGLPIELPIAGERPSFESLFHETTKSRGVTYKSLLNRLLASEAVAVSDHTGNLKLLEKSYLPSGSDDVLGAIEMGFSALGNLVETVTRNIVSLESGKDRLYQRGAWTYRLSKSNRDKLRRELRQLLEETDTDARSIIESYEDDVTSSEHITAGISMFYFEEEG